ncbi:MAG: hypothetical protein GXP29_15490 [Planctomycetes bacterium]|nr:hypothetical protein [Planctomycetota bacterium]
MDRFRKAFAPLLIVALVFSSTGCQDPPPGGGGNTEEAPKIPPASTFVIDFSDFEQEDEGPVLRTRGVLARENWGFAATSAFIWNVILTVNLAVPVASFVESFNNEPTLGPDGVWSWNYSFTAVGVLHSAELQGQINGANITWNMFISKDGEFTDFNWFSGTSDLLGTQGSWTLNKDPDDPTPFIEITYNRDEAANTADIRYTNVIPDSADNGGFIFFAITTDEPFDANYQIFRKAADETTDIEWSRATKDGRVMDEARFGDTEYHCWDEALVDMDCP